VNLDEAFLLAHRSYPDQEHGFEESFETPELAGHPTVAIRSRPLGPARGVAWVVCHSFGVEQVHLYRLEVLAARRLAAAGFPVLRFHVPGYGDSRPRGEPARVEWHVEATVDAARLMRRLDGVERVGLVGARFGALVAGLAAGPAGASALGLWQPFATGAAFLEDFLQTALFEEMLDRPPGTGPPAPAGSDGAGWRDVNGFRLSAEAAERIRGIDLARDLGRFEGPALVVAIARGERMPAEPAAVAELLRSAGAACEERVVRDRSAPVFGQHHFAKVGDGQVERDLFFEAYGAIAGATTAWAVAALAPGGEG
jgi:pimeloyl-ACP methyl ester carboxylesterase